MQPQEKRLLLAFLAVAVAVVSNVVLQRYAVRNIAESARWAMHTNEVRADLFALESAVKDVQRGVRGYLIVHQPESLTPYHQGVESTRRLFREVSTLTSDNPRQQSRLRQIDSQINSLFALLDAEVRAVEAGETRQAEQFVAAGTANSEVNAIEALLSEMLQEEDSLLVQRTANTARSVLTANYSSAAAGILAVALLVWVFYLVVRQNRERQAASGRISGLYNELRQHAEELEERVRERTRELQETNASLEAFSYSVSHDLRAPLRGISGLSNALLEDYAAALDHTAKRYLHGLIESAHKMDALIEQLLAYSRIARHKFESRPVNVDFAIAEARNELESDIARSGAVIQTGNTRYAVMGSQALLTQCLANLLSNAIKFVPPDVKPHIRIDCQETDSRVTISVEDNGIGIAPDEQSKIFMPFERLHGSERYKGSGIGLSIVKSAVERMSGSVGVKSSLNQGSHFWIELPRAAQGPK